MAYSAWQSMGGKREPLDEPRMERGLICTSWVGQFERHPVTHAFTEAFYTFASQPTVLNCRLAPVAFHCPPYPIVVCIDAPQVKSIASRFDAIIHSSLAINTPARNKKAC
ncbi:MAG: hypothetical protein IPQ12_11795 [Polaromonas sp.]|nr:hypothetical protein [Polaromonas sp.]